MPQSGQDFLITYKVETTPGVRPTTLTGAKQFPCNASRGMNAGRSIIRPGIIRSDGQTGGADTGLETVTGEFVADFLPNGVFDEILKAGLRGLIVGTGPGVLKMTNPPTDYSFTFEIRETKNGINREFNGVSITSLGFGLNPNGKATITVGFMGIKGNDPVAGASIFTSPTLYNGDGMSLVNAAYSIDGGARGNITGLDFALDLHAENVAVGGSQYTPAVYLSNMTGTGNFRTIRSAIADEIKFRQKTRFALSVGLAAVAGGPVQYLLLLPRCFFTGYDAPIGATGPLIATLPFEIEYDTTVGGMIEIDIT
jgi:hypothetical protein